MVGQRWANPAHTMGVTIAIPDIKGFVATPNMTPLQIARGQGAEAKRLGRPESENPHTDLLVPNEGQLAAEWLKGYNGG